VESCKSAPDLTGDSYQIAACDWSGPVRGWSIEETEYHPGKEPIGGTHFVTGNGYMGLRGSFEEQSTPAVQGLFVAGVYTEVPGNDDYSPADTFFKKRFVFNEDEMARAQIRHAIVNLPDILSTRIRINGRPFRMWDGGLLTYHRWLDMRTGCTHRVVRWDNGQGQITRLHFERFCSLAQEHLVYLRVSITPENYVGTVSIESGIEASSCLLCQAEYAEAAEDGGTADITIAKCPDTVAQCVRNRLYTDGEPVAVEWGCVDDFTRMARSVELSVAPGSTYTLEKAMTVFTSRDPDTHDARAQAEALAAEALEAGFAECFAEHRRAWDDIWARTDIEIEGDDESQKFMRFALYHLVIAVPRKDSSVSMGARSLSGQAYDGLVFWETDIYLEPYFSWTFPEFARNHFLFRYRTLDGARAEAQALGYPGAKYPWEAALVGREEASSYFVCGGTQIHIVPDVTHAISRYVQVTGDEQYMREYGAEIFFECAKYIVARTSYNSRTDCYEINGIGGPDEYHPVVNNNSYTNFLSARLLEGAVQAHDLLKRTAPDRLAEIAGRIGLADSEFSQWSEIAAKLQFCADEATGLIEQSDGFFKLKDDWEVTGQRFGGPAAEYHTCKGAKQPDVLLLLALFPEVFNRKHYLANYDYYERFVQHGSSLSPSIHALVAAKAGLVQQARDYFLMSGRFVFVDYNKEAHRGVHIGNLGGMWMAMVFGFAGIKLEGEAICLDPHLPQEWKSLMFNLVYRGNGFQVHVAPDKLTITAEAGNQSSIEFRWGDQGAVLDADQTISLP
jgi:kojibiose phosphorylase